MAPDSTRPDTHLEQVLTLSDRVTVLRGWAHPLSTAATDELVRTHVEALDISPADPDLPVKYLSGGNQQKVVLARWLATRPRLLVLVLDGPARGIDVASKVEIQAHIAQLAKEGVSVVYISSELEEVVRLSDRIVVVKPIATTPTTTDPHRGRIATPRHGAPSSRHERLHPAGNGQPFVTNRSGSRESRGKEGRARGKRRAGQRTLLRTARDSAEGPLLRPEWTR